MFHLYHHYDLERLAELLAVLLERRERPHALAPDTVLVPNAGLGQWLKIQLAESEGIAANIEMPLPARHIWDWLPKLLPGRPDSRNFEREPLRWHLYGQLPSLAGRLPEIGRYLADDSDDLKRLQLADRLADVFDQYLIYRPDMLFAWERGEVGDGTTERWQAAVWQALTARLGHDHRARLLRRFIAGGGAPAATPPGPVYCFGLADLPPEYLKFLYALARHCDVHFLLPNPSAGYWGDIQRRPVRLADAPGDESGTDVAHPLLASLGRGTRDLLRVLYSDELTDIHEPELGEALEYRAPSADHLLARVQGDIIAMRATPADQGMPPAADDSVQVHACHSPLRELQVLQDQLLDRLARDPDLQPRDIVVMLPDIAAYAPAIRSVFGAAVGGRRLPFSVSDRSRAASHPIMQSFAQLLNLPLSRWAASEIIALAAVPAVLRRFGLDQSALDTAADWLQAAGVRWGFDAETRTEFQAGATAQNTWRFGLDRLLLGVAQSDEEALVAGVAPWSDLEGGTTAALGKIWQLVETLHSWQQHLASPATAADWQDRLNRLLAALFLPDPGDRDEQAAVDELHAAIATLETAAGILDAEPLSWAAVRELIAGELAQAGRRQPFLSGGITFCGLMPLRAVPFRVVCLLGMNDGAFPRQERGGDFNLLRARPRLGDHSPADDDRLLFLQALLAARDVFYISYTGQDVAGGETLPPSPLVGEWLDCLHRRHFPALSRDDVEARMVARQPLQPFSPRLFAQPPAHPRLFTFAEPWQPASRAGGQPRKPAPGFVDDGRAPAPDADSIDLSELRRFFDHPAKHFLRGKLQVDLESLDEAIEDEEPLALDGLGAWQLRDGLLRQAQRRGDSQVAESPDALWRARGILPPAPLDQAAYAPQAAQVNALLPIWHDWSRDGRVPGWCDIDLALDGYRLRGRIANVWPDGPRLLRPGPLKMKYLLRGWIDYLAYRASGHAGELRLVGLAGKKNTVIDYRAKLDAGSARAELTALLAIFERGQREPLAFMPELARLYLETRDGSGDPAQGLLAVQQLLANSFQPPPEVRDAYFKPLLGGDPPLGADPETSEFCQLAEAVCRPLLRHLQAVEGEK